MMLKDTFMAHSICRYSYRQRLVHEPNERSKDLKALESTEPSSFYVYACNKLDESLCWRHRWEATEFWSSHCCFFVSIQRHSLKDLLLQISANIASSSLSFSPLYWFLFSHSFTHILNSTSPHLKEYASDPTACSLQSQPGLLIF